MPALSAPSCDLGVKRGRSTRQHDRECRAPTGLAVDLDTAAMRRDDAVADRETEAGSGTDVLGGEERIEDAGANVARDPRTIVVDDDAHRVGVCARRDG